MSDWTMSSVAGERMLDEMPGYYLASRVMRSLLDAQGAELDRLRQALDETLNQMFIGTATWGLDLWEAEFGIPTDVNKPADQRRSNILSKIRGTGTVTVKLLQSVAESFANGAIQVTEQPAQYQFTVKFVDTHGLPPDLDDIKSAIEAIKPAHLAVQYSFRYFNLNEVQNMTLDQIQTHPLTDFAPFLDV